MNLQNATKGFEFLLNGKEEKSGFSRFFFFVNVLHELLCTDNYNA